MVKRHVHCDSDPIECSVQAMEGELAEMRRQRDHCRAALVRLTELARRLFPDESESVLSDAIAPDQSCRLGAAPIADG